MARILMVSAEAAPFAHSGGLADVMDALPKALAAAGEEVAVVLPFYGASAAANPRTIYQRLNFSLGPHTFSANVLERPRNGVRYLFVRIPELYDRPELYGNGTGDYPDNLLRFAALCRAALGIARYIFPADIIHAHDWQAALLPVFLRDTYRYHPAFASVRSVFTIHNLGYQGLFPTKHLAELGLPERLAKDGALEFWGKLNLVKGGILFADTVTTVSPGYAREIQTPEYGFGLDGLLRTRSANLIGILNGADYDTWNPATDCHLRYRFDAANPAGKELSKAALLEEVGLPLARKHKPLIGMISRFASQKGIGLLMQIAHELAGLDVNLVVHGSGEERFEDFFRWFQSAYSDRVALKTGFDVGLAHRLIAGSDFMLIPSLYEPCGLNQIYGMRYGAAPIVRATGGLDDTVDAETGFKFPGETPRDLLNCIRAAAETFRTPQYSDMRKAAMEKDFSWRRSAAEYIRLYERLNGPA